MPAFAQMTEAQITSIVEHRSANGLFAEDEGRAVVWA